jgi:hypothetical protein
VAGSGEQLAERVRVAGVDHLLDSVDDVRSVNMPLSVSFQMARTVSMSPASTATPAAVMASW